MLDILCQDAKLNHVDIICRLTKKIDNLFVVNKHEEEHEYS